MQRCNQVCFLAHFRLFTHIQIFITCYTHAQIRTCSPNASQAPAVRIRNMLNTLLSASTLTRMQHSLKLWPTLNICRAYFSCCIAKPHAAHDFFLLLLFFYLLLSLPFVFTKFFYFRLFALHFGGNFLCDIFRIISSRNANTNRVAKQQQWQKTERKT